MSPLPRSPSTSKITEAIEEKEEKRVRFITPKIERADGSSPGDYIDRLLRCNALIEMANERNDYPQGHVTNQEEMAINHIWQEFFRNYKSQLIMSRVLLQVERSEHASAVRADAVYKLTALLREDEQGLLAAFTELSINQIKRDALHHHLDKNIEISVKIALIYAITNTRLLQSVNKISRCYIAKWIHTTNLLRIVKHEIEVNGEKTIFTKVQTYRVYEARDKVYRESLRAI
jgi:hypothetical protein